MRFLSQAGILLCIVLSLWADDRKKARQYVKPAQIADLEGAKLVTAKQNCENWALAAGLEAILKQQDVPLDQNFWVMHMNGGELCTPEVPSADALADVVNREFVVEDGRHVLLELHFASGAPDNPDALIAGLKQQRLSLMLLHGHVYYLTGVTYDEVIHPDGSRMFLLTELRLANTFAHQPGFAFTKDRDNMDDIGGIITVSATTVAKKW